MSEQERLLYDAVAAAVLLSTTPRRISELRRAGELIAVQDGRTYKFRRDDLEHYVASLRTYEPKRWITP